MSEDTKTEGQEPTGKENNDNAPETFDRATVEGLRREAADWRTKLRDAEKNVETLTGKLVKFEDADKSELEKIVAKATRLEELIKSKDDAITEAAVRTAIQLAAAKAGVQDVGDVLALIDRSDIDCSEGQVSGEEKALKKLLKDKPYLVASEVTPAPPPSPGVGGPPVEGKSNEIDNAFLGLIQSAQTEQT